MQILAGRHLFKAGKGVPSPFVEVEILGAYYEDTKKFKTEKKGEWDNASLPCTNGNPCDESAQLCTACVTDAEAKKCCLLMIT